MDRKHERGYPLWWSAAATLPYLATLGAWLWWALNS